MFKKLTSRSADGLLPWYLNHSLPKSERLSGEEQARQHPRSLHAWQAIRTAAVSQPQRLPSAAVRQRLMAQTRGASHRARLPQWRFMLSGTVLAVIALMLLWTIVQPGIGLQWSVAGGVPAAFRIYRAPLGSDRFEVVHVVPAQSGTLDYAYVDTALLPGQTYQYRVEAVNAEAASATIAANGAAVLPAQLAIVLSSVLIGLAGACVMRELIALSRPIHWKAV